MKHKDRAQLSDSSFKFNRSNLYSRVLHINALRLLWVMVVIWGELGVFYWTLINCRWPTIEGIKDDAVEPAHVLLLSDTQVRHPLLQSRGEAWTSIVRRFFYDLNLRKSWCVASRLKPGAVIFLGDMLATGKLAKNERSYTKAVEKFKSIFHIDEGVASYSVPGNNDIAMGEITPLATRVRGYFTNNFGPLNQRFEIQNHTFVALNAPGLVDEDYQRAGKGLSFDKWKPIPDGPIAFVQDVASTREDTDRSRNPTILLSHIPLARPEMAYCGPLREKGTIRRDVGHGYQSMLGRQTTSFLLQTLQPLAVFSGDNRDYCEYNHTIPDDAHSIREVTLKSFSMSVHIRRPGFQLLSLIPPSSRIFPNQNTIADTPCFLPDQGKIYTSLYAPVALFTILALFISNLRRSRSSRPFSRKPAPIRVGATSGVSSRRVSGRSSPVHHPRSLGAPETFAWTPTWSPYTPNTPHSPRTPFPGSLRAPHKTNAPADPSLGATSRPVSPIHGSVPESPFAHAGEEEDDDPMQPSHYAVRREGHRHYSHDDEEWSDVGRPREEDWEYNFVPGDTDVSNASLPEPATAGPSSSTPRIISQFISAPETSDRDGRDAAWSWSWTFVLAGRRRRITLGTPTLSGLKNLLELFKGADGKRRHRRSLMSGMLLDLFSVSCPAFVIWWLIIWFIL